MPAHLRAKLLFGEEQELPPKILMRRVGSQDLFDWIKDVKKFSV